MMSRSVDVRQPGPRVGKAPPIDTFTGKKPDIVWEGLLPTFELAANWNGWDEEKLLQLAGHLRHKALQEWNLLSDVVRSSYLLACREKIGNPYFISSRSKNIEIYGPPGTKMFEIIGPPLIYFIPPTKFI